MISTIMSKTLELNLHFNNNNNNNTWNRAVAVGARVAAKVMYIFRAVGLNSRPPCNVCAVLQGPQATG